MSHQIVSVYGLDPEDMRLLIKDRYGNYIRNRSVDSMPDKQVIQIFKRMYGSKKKKDIPKPEPQPYVQLRMDFDALSKGDT